MGTAKRERQKANRQQRLEQMARQVQKERRKKGFTRWGVLAVVGAVAIILIAVISGGSKKSTDASATSTTVADLPTTSTTAVPVVGATLTGDTPCPPTDGSAAKTVTFAKAPPTCIDPAKTYTATLSTNKGAYTVALDAKNAPVTVNNFVVLARYHFFDGTPCHRILKGFMAQCGDPTGTGSSGATQANPTGLYPGYAFNDENQPADKAYKAGQLAMANSGANTNGAQFFTLFAPYNPPSGGYNVFGTVTAGADTTLKAIEAAASPADGAPPTEPIVLQSVTITES